MIPKQKGFFDSKKKKCLNKSLFIKPSCNSMSYLCESKKHGQADNVKFQCVATFQRGGFDIKPVVTRAHATQFEQDLFVCGSCDGVE